MNHYYFSKYDTVSWAWWKEKAIHASDKDDLDVLNAQLKAFCPSKYLLILNAGAHFYLISERNQVGRDSGGRTFSARHFARGGKTELEEKNSLLRIVNSFLDPVDYALPEENTFLPAAQPGRFSEEVYFDLIWDACMRGRKICIVNEEVDQYSHTSKENLATLVFANFPGAQGLLNAMNLLPPAIQKKISACFNYENNFIASGKLSQVNIIFCGNKTLIEDGIEDVHEINFELLKSSGFDVLKIAQFENDEKKWAVVFRFLNNQDAVADLFYAGIYHKWCAQNTQASLVKMVQYCSFLANMSSSIEQYQPAFESVQELLSITGLTIDEKLQLYEKAISSLSTDALAADFYLYAGLAESAELESAFTMLLQKYFDASQLRPEQKMLLFTHPDFEKLHPAQKIFLYESFWNTSYKRDFFSQPATLKIIKSLPQSIKPAGLDNVWEEYLPPAPILLTDIDALEVLFNKTQKEQEYALVLSKAFDHMADAAWLAAAVKANIKLDIDFPESISGIDEAKRYVEIISDHGKALLVEWLLQFEKKVASILDYTDDLTGLLFFEKAVRKHHVFQLISKYKEVIAAINKRIAGLLVAKLTDEPETFHHQLAEASPDGDALKKEIEKSVQPNCYAIIDFGFLINYTRLLKKSSFSHGEIIHRINSFLAYYKEISPALQGNKNKIDKALLKELKKIKGYETLPGALLNHLDSFWGKVKKKSINNKWVLIFFCAILAGGLMYVFVFLPESTLPVKPEPPIPVLAQQVDSTAIWKKNAETFLNHAFFTRERDTLTFNQFKEKMKLVNLVKFQFRQKEFKQYAIIGAAKSDSSQAWNWFVDRYKDSLAYYIEFEHVVRNNDSFKNIVSIKLK